MTPSTRPVHPLQHPSVLSAIQLTLLRRGVRRDALPDATSEVQTRALEATRQGPVPADASEWAALCTTIATCFAIDEGRKKVRRAKSNAGLCEAPEEHAALAPSGKPRDAVDAGRQLEVLRDVVNPAQLELLDAVAAGTSHKDIAEELGISEQAVADRLARLRRRFRLRIAALGMTMLTAMLVVLLSVPLGGIAVRDPPLLPRKEAPVQVPTPEQLASVLRQDAMRACDSEEWTTCVAKLDEARALDPAGDGSPEVQDARERVEASRMPDPRELMAKPRPR